MDWSTLKNRIFVSIIVFYIHYLGHLVNPTQTPLIAAQSPIQPNTSNINPSASTMDHALLRATLTSSQPNMNRPPLSISSLSSASSPSNLNSTRITTPLLNQFNPTTAAAAVYSQHSNTSLTSHNGYVYTDAITPFFFKL